MYKEPIQELIAQQIKVAADQSNASRPSLRFTGITKAALQNRDILSFLSTPDNLSYVSRLLAKQIRAHLFQTMPYFEMDNFTQEILFSVCKSLFVDVKRGYRIDDVERKHFQRYKAWLELLCGKKKKRVSATDMATKSMHTEYSAELQVKVLGLDQQEVKTPLLDIGCGENGHLVTYLRNQGVPAFGLDRVADDSLPYFFQEYWWDFDFAKETWGTITAHHSFSTHFLHAHLLQSAFSVRYAKLYLTILESLQPGGSFRYAPGLPFMEQWLPSERFEVTYTSLNEAFQATIVTRK